MGTFLLFSRGIMATIRWVLLLVVIFCSSVAAEQPEKVRVAGIFDLTGGGAIWGKSERNAFELACRDFESKHITDCP